MAVFPPLYLSLWKDVVALVLPRYPSLQTKHDSWDVMVVVDFWAQQTVPAAYQASVSAWRAAIVPWQLRHRGGGGLVRRTARMAEMQRETERAWAETRSLTRGSVIRDGARAPSGRRAESVEARLSV